MWASCPASPRDVGPVLDAYFEGRRACFPEAPTPTMGKMLKLALSPAVSAPGADNEPYELHHVGAHFVAQLLGQALLSMAVSDAALSSVAGAAVDLLLWIPKKGAATGPGEMRPCSFRRASAAWSAPRWPTLLGPLSSLVSPHGRLP